MGQSTDGQLSFGVKFPEDFEFPWDDYDDAEDWWRKASGYQPPFELYDKSGGYVGGQRPSQEKVDEYLERQKEWDAKHPMPFQLVNYCHLECPMHILAVPGTVVTANRGVPAKINPLDMKNALEPSAVERFKKFLAEYVKIDPGEGALSWWLSSYWD